MTTFSSHSIDSLDGEARELLEGVNQAFGFVPELFSYMAEAPVTIKAYLQLNQLLQETSFSNQQLQVALLAVSLENNCKFCAAAHTFSAKKHSVNVQTLDALLAGGDIANQEEAVLVSTVRAVVKQRGWVDAKVLEDFFNAGFSHKHYLELQIVVAIKTLSNYINHQIEPDINPEFLSA
ncbi:carboxymuconolactone decarboxylase family protein [Gilvimarinus sp. SDUM040013]|uniref:Carboxymuconolactone decarboxylase family protein n=1 Tax=Gilvimarinus gilvus TaxID=3058038 RepID=A0ABU4S3G4_9GAMM|nr:carboxymuconolactone decarboxylase family protein [Gilvimarinus sp. SDUM040013]MDO3385371.1 carboxymuconolactone decarboxylase family protein [Gilvimarinus sp. SDUM040013]MDX6850946.1 carboxymuconolactone decarboxylase family protein [Gilvimarinus sp. SDUM040013]